jgi:hypothetical protein
MTRVLLSTLRLLEFPEGGGHFWVYMQYAEALRRLGCEVQLLDSLAWSTQAPDDRRIGAFFDRLARHGFGDGAIVAATSTADTTADGTRFPGMSASEVHDRLAEFDLLLNFNYGLGQELVSAVRRTALVDIDPGLLQFWVQRGYILPATHDRYFTTGETVGTPRSAIPDCGLPWVRIRPPVCLERWPYAYHGDAEAFTTVSTWWSERDYVGEPGDYYDNTKRTAFQPFADLPRHTEQPLELALYLADGDEPERATLERRGWRIRHSRDVAGSPEAYQAYVQGSRGEFSWAKASCVRWQNAWVSDRSLCYLASGKPVVVQHTGASSVLPDGEGMFRFRTMAEAARALHTINADYERQCRLARSLAEEHFDAKRIVGRILEVAL